MRSWRAHVVLTGFLSATAPLSFSHPSSADTVQGTRFEVVERAHTVEMRLDRGHATLVVTRTVENPGPKSDQAIFFIDLPDGAVATRLRTSGVNAKGETVWFEGELLEAEEAARRYQELTGIGGYYPKDPALLSWRSQTRLALQVFPVPARATKVVEYTLRMPLSYADGHYSLHLPKLGTDSVPAKVRVLSERAEDRVTINGVTVSSSGAQVPVPVVATRDLDIELTPRMRDLVDGAVASFGYAKDKNLVHSRIDVTPRLSEPPVNASVVVLIDTSRSMGDSVGLAVSAARAYLSQFPGASVEVMTFDRRVRSPFGGALPVRDALSRLYSFSPAVANGSQLDDALSRADAKLAASPARPGARRILVITDLLTRQALGPERLAARTMASGALVHVSTVAPGDPELERDDEDEWAKLPRKTGGLLWRAHCSPTLDAVGRTVFEEWVRPKRIEKVVIKGLPPDFYGDPTLREGQGVDFLGIADQGVSQVSLEGELWSSPVRWSRSVSADEGRRWAGLAFGTELLSSFSEPEMMTLAMHGRAVSPVTSYLAIEPGVRPSTEGLDWAEGGGGGGRGEGIGLGTIGTLGHGAGRTNVDHQMFLDNALGQAMSSCGAGAGTSARAKIESTLSEIVDVRDVTLSPTHDAKTETCIAEKLWAVTLLATFTDTNAEWEAKAKL